MSHQHTVTSAEPLFGGVVNAGATYPLTPEQYATIMTDAVLPPGIVQQDEAIPVIVTPMQQSRVVSISGVLTAGSYEGWHLSASVSRPSRLAETVFRIVGADSPKSWLTLGGLVPPKGTATERVDISNS